MPVENIDAKGLACPEPVLLAMKAIEEGNDVIIIVDNEIAVENIRRLALKTACLCSVEEKGETWEIGLVRTGATGKRDSEEAGTCGVSAGKQSGPFVVVFSDNRMGRGDDALGEILIRTFCHTLGELKPLPQAIVCYNAGVKLAVTGSPVLEDLQRMQQAGVDIQVCGTCLGYYNLKDHLAAGRISNMYDILDTMAGAGRLVRP